MSDLHIETHGRGTRHVVLLHGWAMHGGVLAPLTEALSHHATVHVVDLPGHGYSRDCAIPLEPATCAAAIAAVTPPATWLGWSLGGAVALTAALAHPDKVQSLAMVCTSPCFVRKAGWAFGMPREVFTAFGEELDHNYRITLERFLALEALGSAHARDDMERLHADVFARGKPDKRVLAEGLDILEHFDLRSRLPELVQRSVWIAGARDRLIRWQAMEWSARQCGGSFTRIEHAGHAPFIGFVDAVMRALEPLTSAPASRKQA